MDQKFKVGDKVSRNKTSCIGTVKKAGHGFFARSFFNEKRRIFFISKFPFREKTDILYIEKTFFLC